MKVADIEQAAPPTDKESFTAGALWLCKQLYTMPLDIAIDTICKLCNEVNNNKQ